MIKYGSSLKEKNKGMAELSSQHDAHTKVDQSALDAAFYEFENDDYDFWRLQFKVRKEAIEASNFSDVAKKLLIEEEKGMMAYYNLVQKNGMYGKPEAEFDRLFNRLPVKEQEKINAAATHVNECRKELLPMIGREGLARADNIVREAGKRAVQATKNKKN